MIKVDLVKAKEQAHVVRRAKRDELFKPLDVKVTIPDEAIAAEAARVVVRASNVATKLQIDEVIDGTGDVYGTEVAALKAALASL